MSASGKLLRLLIVMFFPPSVEQQSWSPCANATRVVEERIAGGGHTWPGALGKSGPGTTDDSISATREIARFFAL